MLLRALSKKTSRSLFLIETPVVFQPNQASPMSRENLVIAVSCNDYFPAQKSQRSSTLLPVRFRKHPFCIPKYLPVDEKHPTDPITSYGITKLAIEKYLQLFQHLHGLSYVCIRAANPYGPGQSPFASQ